MTIASRFYGTFAAFALVLAALVAVAPSPARANATEEALIVGAVVTATVFAAIVLLGDNNDNDNGNPQSP